VESTVAVFFGLFEAPLFGLEDTLAEVALNLGTVFHETIDGNIICFGNELKGTHEAQVDPASHLLLYELENLLFHLTTYTVETFKTELTFRPNRLRNALRASISEVLFVLAMNLLSKISSALTNGSKRS